MPHPMTLLSPKRDLGLSVDDRCRLSVAQYHRLAATGILDEHAPVELLEGWLVCKYRFSATPYRGFGRVREVT